MRPEFTDAAIDKIIANEWDAEPEDLGREIKRLRRALKRAGNDLMFLAGYTAPVSAYLSSSRISPRVGEQTVTHFKAAMDRIDRALGSGRAKGERRAH